MESLGPPLYDVVGSADSGSNGVSVWWEVLVGLPVWAEGVYNRRWGVGLPVWAEIKGELSSLRIQEAIIVITTFFCPKTENMTCFRNRQVQVQ